MKIFRTVKEMQEFALRLKQEGRRIGLVPTMGALHEGHLTLMRAAKEATDFGMIQQERQNNIINILGGHSYAM